jgi:PAS domain S-box-containing protein
VDDRRTEAEVHTAARFGIGRLFWLTHDAIVVADLSSETVVLWNPSAERVFGWSAEEAVGMPLDRLVPDGLREAHHAGIARYRTTGVARLVGGEPVEVPAVAKDGTLRFVALTLTAVDERDPARHVLAIVRDVTSQKAAEDDLQRANRAMQSFVATASHDLRTPLTSVVGYARLLQQHGSSLDEEQRDTFVAAVLRAGEQAVRLVDDLLTLSKIQAGAVDVRKEAVAVPVAAQEAASDAGVDVELDRIDQVAVHVDRDHLHRILVNLLANGAKYGKPPLSLSATSDNGCVEVRLTDEGDGVPEDFRPRLFEAFARADSARTLPGTGLGLSIVKGLVEANGGEVRYEPGIPRGACFVVRLERAAPESA